METEFVINIRTPMSLVPGNQLGGGGRVDLCSVLEWRPHHITHMEHASPERRVVVSGEGRYNNNTVTTLPSDR